jgi:predicted anti-sigma-YlaC factor YlaD
VLCEEVAEILPGILDGGAVAAPFLVRHVEECTTCQAEVARYRLLLRMLRQLAAQRPDPPEGVLGDVLDALEAAAKRRAIRSALTGRRIAYGGGLAAGGLAAIAVLLTVRARGSRKMAAAVLGRAEPGAIV